MRFRFGLRSLVLVVTVVGVALWAVPAAMDWYYWHRVRSTVIGTMTDLNGPPTQPSVFLGWAKQNQYYLSNHEIKWDATVGAMTDSSALRRSDAVFVIFPDTAGPWADSPDKVVQILRQASAAN